MSVIPVSPVRDRTDERQTGAFRNDGTTLADWAAGEAAWFGKMFIRVAASVAFTRWVYGKMFGGGLVSKAVFDRAQDLMHPGRRKRPFTVPPGTAPPPGSGYRPPGGSSSAAPAGASASSNGTAEATHAAQAPEFRSNGADRARIVKQIGEHILSHHNTLLREDHFWPCPITNHREACTDCGFFVVREKVAMCAAVEKLRQLLAGQDDGTDLYEMHERLKRG